MTRKKDFIFRIIDILMRTFDCINTHHTAITSLICELLSTVPTPAETDMVKADSVSPPCENEVQLASPNVDSMFDVGNDFFLKLKFVD